MNKVNVLLVVAVLSVSASSGLYGQQIGYESGYSAGFSDGFSEGAAPCSLFESLVDILTGGNNE